MDKTPKNETTANRAFTALRSMGRTLFRVHNDDTNSINVLSDLYNHDPKPEGSQEQ